MRDRKLIHDEFTTAAPVGQFWHIKLFLEVLLDIRDLLAKPK